MASKKCKTLAELCTTPTPLVRTIWSSNGVTVDHPFHSTVDETKLLRVNSSASNTSIHHCNSRILRFCSSFLPSSLLFGPPSFTPLSENPLSKTEVGSIEGRVGVHHLDDAQQSKNFTFKCHREGNEIYSVNSLNFHPVHHTFATSGSDGAFNFWDKDSKQRLKAMTRCSQPIPCSAFNNDGSIFAYLVCYDYSKGAENHNPATAKAHIFLHLLQEYEVKGKPRISTGRK